MTDHHEAKTQLTHLRAAAEDIATRFQLDEKMLSWPDETQTAYDELHALLKAQVTKMLARRPESLMQLLYRIDVNEAKVNAVMSGPLSDLTDQLTTLIIERQLQKMLLRQQAASWLPVMDEE